MCKPWKYRNKHPVPINPVALPISPHFNTAHMNPKCHIQEMLRELKGSQPLVFGKKEGFPEEGTSERPLEREMGKRLRLDRR